MKHKCTSPLFVVAIFATFGITANSISPKPIGLTAAYAGPTTPPVSGPQSVYSCYLLVNGTLEDCTANIAYAEDHVFLSGEDIGTVGSDNSSIYDYDGNYLGYLQMNAPE